MTKENTKVMTDTMKAQRTLIVTSESTTRQLLESLLKNHTGMGDTGAKIWQAICVLDNEWPVKDTGKPAGRDSLLDENEEAYKTYQQALLTGFSPVRFKAHDYYENALVFRCLGVMQTNDKKKAERIKKEQERLEAEKNEVSENVISETVETEEKEIETVQENSETILSVVLENLAVISEKMTKAQILTAIAEIQELAKVA